METENDDIMDYRYLLPPDEFRPEFYKGDTPQERAFSLLRGVNALAAQAPRFSAERKSAVVRAARVLEWPSDSVDSERAISWALREGVPDFGGPIWWNTRIPATVEQRDLGLIRLRLLSARGPDPCSPGGQADTTVAHAAVLPLVREVERIQACVR